MRITRVFLLAILFAACAPEPVALRRAPSIPPIVEVPERPTRYLKTLGGGWRIKLADDRRSLTACQYGLRVGHVRPINRTLYLRVEFENPQSRSRPLFVDAKIEPWMHELAIRSPEVRGLRKGSRYLIRIHIYDHPSRTRRIGIHDQMIPARLNVKSDGRVSF